MRIIFLDIDGVLITERSMRESGRFDVPDKDCIAQLNRITDTTGAAIVISSSWGKVHGLDKTVDYLRLWGVTGSIIDKTPERHRQGHLYTAATRGDEMEDWLVDFAFYHPGLPPFVILDDDADMGYLIDWLVRCDFTTGLTRELADRAIAMLEEK